MQLRIAAIVLLAYTLTFGSFLSANQDWYSYYVQCVAGSNDEENCYQSIRDFLSTPEGHQQAQELGFKRKRNFNDGQVSVQSVVIVNRIGQMENYLISALDKARDEGDTIQTYCLAEKKEQVMKLKKSIEEKKSEILNLVQSVDQEKIESHYQIMLSLNSRANELYQQARKCIEAH
jgi:hypothetical protein